MGLRPARTCRGLEKTPWARFSKKKPRKSFVKAMPHNSLNVYSMGLAGSYELSMSLVADYGVQIRDNALESARQAANKYLEKAILNNYFLTIQVFPHNVIRENKMISGAGADRIQKGMRKSYGRSSDRAARLKKGQVLMTAFINEKNVLLVKEAYRRAKGKLPGSFTIETKKEN
jgi:large subunit ribosomal protein L10e